MNNFSWEGSSHDAIELQNRLRSQVISWDMFEQVERIAGIDVGLAVDGQVARAAVVVLRAADMSLEDAALAERPVTFPYIPGLLSFREAPVIMDALDKLRAAPDLLVCDGQGLAHPRRFGLACHLGILTGLPAIGAAKSRLIGKHETVGDEKGDWAYLKDGEEIIGAALRTRARTKPIYVSTGHRICLETAVGLVLRCATKYRIPEPTRLAHQMACGRNRS